MEKIEIELLKPTDLIPYIRNARTHSDYQVQQIAGSIREFGFTNPILIDENNNIIAGHGRMKAAEVLRLPKVPCIRLKNLSDIQKQAYILADNKLALNAGWDAELLKIEIEDLQLGKYDLSLTGFNDAEIAAALADGLNSDNVNPDEEWQDMPEFNQNDETSWRHIIVHFNNQSDLDKFEMLIEQKITDKTKSIWYPKMNRMDTESKRYE